jgi:hypothetical protein
VGNRSVALFLSALLAHGICLINLKYIFVWDRTIVGGSNKLWRSDNYKGRGKIRFGFALIFGFHLASCSKIKSDMQIK